MGKTWKNLGKNQNDVVIYGYLWLFGKKSGGFGNVNGHEEYATWFNEFNVVLFPF